MSQGFYRGDDDAPLQQGDIVLAPIGRLQDPHAAPPPRWQSLDQRAADYEFPDLGMTVRAVGGFALAMVVTHDCQLDKELIDAVERLRKEEQLSINDAIARAEADPDLDRFICVAPLVSLEGYRAQPVALRENKVIGAFHVVPWEDRGVDESVVDLTYRATVDRHTVVRRLAVLTDEARGRLRFALSRLDAFRTPSIGFELEAAIGKRVRSVRKHRDNPMVVIIEIADGAEIELVLQPAATQIGSIARTAAP